MRSNIIPFAGVAQPERRVTNHGDAGETPVPRSIEANAPRAPLDTRPLLLAFAVACAGVAILQIGLTLYAFGIVFRGLP